MGGSVCDGKMRKQIEWRRGSVHGNCDQKMRYIKDKATSSRKIKECHRRIRVHGYCPRSNMIASRSGREEQKEKRGRTSVQLGQ